MLNVYHKIETLKYSVKNKLIVGNISSSWLDFCLLDACILPLPLPLNVSMFLSLRSPSLFPILLFHFIFSAVCVRFLKSCVVVAIIDNTFHVKIFAQSNDERGWEME